MREKRRVSTRKVSLARTTKERFAFLNWRFTAFRNMLVVPLFLGSFIELIWNILDELFSLQKAIKEAFSMQISFLLEDSVLNGLFLEGEASEYKTYGFSHACD